MRTVRRLLYREILGATAFVMLAFLGLFLFIDLVGELDDIGKGGYTLGQALLMCALLVPGHVYELAPIGVLIGAIYALARLAQSSEFTILRTGGARSRPGAEAARAARAGNGRAHLHRRRRHRAVVRHPGHADGVAPQRPPRHRRRRRLAARQPTRHHR